MQVVTLAGKASPRSLDVKTDKATGARAEPGSAFEESAGARVLAVAIGDAREPRLGIRKDHGNDRFCPAHVGLNCGPSHLVLAELSQW